MMHGLQTSKDPLKTVTFLEAKYDFEMDIEYVPLPQVISYRLGYLLVSIHSPSNLNNTSQHDTEPKKRLKTEFLTVFTSRKDCIEGDIDNEIGCIGHYVT